MAREWEGRGWREGGSCRPQGQGREGQPGRAQARARLSAGAPGRQLTLGRLACALGCPGGAVSLGSRKQKALSGG